MASPQQIQYSNSIVLNVTNVDNSLLGIMAPDTSGSGGKRTTVFSYDCDGYSGQANTTVNLLNTVQQIGGSPVLAMIGTNYRGGGSISFTITTDKECDPITGSFDLSEWSSSQLAYQFVKA